MGPRRLFVQSPAPKHGETVKAREEVTSFSFVYIPGGLDLPDSEEVSR